MAIVLPDWRVSGGGFDGGAGGIPQPFEEIPIGPLDGTNRTFRLSFTPWLGFLQVFINSAHQNKFVPNFTLAGNIVTYAVAPSQTDAHYCWYFRGPASAAALQARGFGTAGVNANDAVDYGASLLYNLTGDLSVGVWFKLGTSPKGLIVFRGNDIGGDTGKNDNYALYPIVNGSAWDIGYEHEYGSASGISLTFGAALATGRWYYGGISRDTIAKTVTLYIGDGVTISPISAQAYSNNPSGGAGDCKLIVGRGYPATDFASQPTVFDGGYIQEHMIWSRVLTQAEHLSASQGNPSRTNLILWSSMGNSPEIDNSGNGGSGAVTGTLLVQGH